MLSILPLRSPAVKHVATRKPLFPLTSLKMRFPGDGKNRGPTPKMQV